MNKTGESKFFYGWIIVLISMLALAVSNGLAIGGFPVFFGPIRESFKATGAVADGAAESFIGVSASLTFLTAGLISPISGWMIQKFSVRMMMLLGCLLLGAGLLIHAHSVTVEGVYFSRILMGASLGFIGVLANVVLVSNWFIKKRGLALGIVLVGTSLGGIIIPPIAVPLIESVGWRFAMMILSGIIWLVLAPLLFFFIKERPEDIGKLPDGIEKEEAEGNEEAKIEAIEKSGYTLGGAMRTPIFWVFSIVAALIFYPIFVSSQQFILYLQSSQIGLTEQQGALALSGLFFVSVGGKFLFGALSDRFSPSKVLLLCVSIMFLGSLSLLNLSAASAFLYLIPMGLGYGGSFVLLQRLVGDYFGNMDYPKILGVITVVETLGAAIGGVVTGRMADAAGGDYTNAFFVIIFVTLILVGFVIGLNILAPRWKFTNIAIADSDVAGEG